MMNRGYDELIDEVSSASLFPEQINTKTRIEAFKVFLSFF